MHLRSDPDLSRFGVIASSLDKVLWPAVGFTKGEMLDYYARVAGTLLPHVAARPLTLGRFPDGVDGPGFAQIECRGRPSWVRSEPVRLRDGRLRNFCLADDVRSLLCEGGPTLFGALLQEDLVDELFVSLAPKVTGGGTAPAISAGPELAELCALSIVWALELDGTLYLRYAVRR